jgi:hypothetical protein
MTIRRLMPLVLAALLLAGNPPRTLAETPLSREAAIADLRMTPDAGWRFFTDQVMGGISTGGVVFADENSKPFARMTGRVSTANRGGWCCHVWTAPFVQGLMCASVDLAGCGYVSGLCARCM